MAELPLASHLLLHFSQCIISGHFIFLYFLPLNSFFSFLMKTFEFLVHVLIYFPCFHISGCSHLLFIYLLSGIYVFYFLLFICKLLLLLVLTEFFRGVLSDVFFFFLMNSIGCFGKKHEGHFENSRGILGPSYQMS